MARYEYQFTIIHRCGHPGSYKATRDQLLPYKARLRERDCDECRNTKGGREVLVIDGQECIIPPITIGSEAQIEWAVKIRRKTIAALLKGHRQGDPNPVEWMLKSQATASWWIEKRNVKPADLPPKFPQAA